MGCRRIEGFPEEKEEKEEKEHIQETEHRYSRLIYIQYLTTMVAQ